ncbi:hypothetical protein STEG23_013899 [Scotinomys teguina]
MISRSGSGQGIHVVPAVVPRGKKAGVTPGIPSMKSPSLGVIASELRIGNTQRSLTHSNLQTDKRLECKEKTHLLFGKLKGLQGFGDINLYILKHQTEIAEAANDLPAAGKLSYCSHLGTRLSLRADIH